MSIKQLIKRFLASRQLELRRLPKSAAKTIGELRYKEVLPSATYAPWLTDSEFMRWSGKIAGNTLVDQYRCFELWELVGQLESIPGDLIEVGVWRGGTGALIARRAQALHGQRKVYLCDTFTGVVKASAQDNTYREGSIQTPRKSTCANFFQHWRSTTPSS